MDRQCSHQKFFQNMCRKRAADESEFDEHLFQKRSESVDDGIVDDDIVDGDIVVAAVSAAVMLGHPAERSPKIPNVPRDKS